MTFSPHVVLGIDTTLDTLAEAEHALLGFRQNVVLPETVMVCTHEVRNGSPHYAFSVSFGSIVDAGTLRTIRQQFEEQGWAAGEDDDRSSASGVRQALSEVQAGNGGRAVVFPGSSSVIGAMSVGEVLAVSALDRVVVLGGVAVDDDIVETRDFVRPLWRDGELVLPVLPAGDHRFAPFEVPNPTPCCAVHA